MLVFKGVHSRFLKFVIPETHHSNLHLQNVISKPCNSMESCPIFVPKTSLPSLLLTKPFRTKKELELAFVIWLVVSTPLKNITQNGNLPRVGVKIKNIGNHHLDYNLHCKILVIPNNWNAHHSSPFRKVRVSRPSPTTPQWNYPQPETMPY